MLWLQKREDQAREKRALIASLTDEELRELDAALHSSLESIQQADETLLQGVYDEMAKRQQASRASNSIRDRHNHDTWELHWKERDERIKSMLTIHYQERLYKKDEKVVEGVPSSSDNSLSLC